MTRYRIISATRPMALRSTSSRLAGADAKHARALDQQEIGAGEPNAAGETDHQDARAPGDAAHAVLEYLAADRIEHHIGAAPIGDALDGVAERFASVEHQMIGAPPLRHREFVLAGGHRDHGRAEHLAHLDRGKANAAAGAVHQQHFTRLKLAAIDQRVIRRAVRGQKCRALGKVEGRRQRRQLRRRDDGLIGISAVPHLDDHPVADRDALHGTIDLDDLTRGLHAGSERQRWLQLILARRHQYIGKVDPGGMNGDAHLALRQRRRGKSLQTQTLGRTEFAADDRLRHQAALALRRCSASRISGIRSLPKYMSVLSMKMVGEPKPPRAITSSVFALSCSLIACSPIPAKNFRGSTLRLLQTSVSTASWEMSLSPPQ